MDSLRDFSVHSGPLIDDLVCVTAAGAIDSVTAPRLRDILHDLIVAGNYDLVVDLNHVHFIDSAGIGVLLGALKQVSDHDGRIWVVCSHSGIKKVFTITGLSAFFGILDTQAEVLARHHRKRTSQ